MIKKILLALLAVLVVLQFFQIDKTNPPTDPAKDFITLEQPPQEIGTLLKNACYDCHSNETKYPWYTNIQPLAWWIRGHIRGGRHAVNFSEWASYNPDDIAHIYDEVAEVVSKKEMPLRSYVNMHPEAKLTDAQRQTITAWFQSKMGGGAPETKQGGETEEHGEHEGHNH